MAHAKWEELRRHILSGNPITELEALTIFGVTTLRHLIAEMRKQGWEVDRRKTSYKLVVPRINKFAEFSPPKDLDIDGLSLAEYFLRTQPIEK